MHLRRAGLIFERDHKRRGPITTQATVDGNLVTGQLKNSGHQTANPTLGRTATQGNSRTGRDSTAMPLLVPPALGILRILPAVGWRPVDRAAFGLLYGAIMVLSLLMAFGAQREAPFKAAVVLFGSVLAMTSARILAELVARSIETGETMLTRKSVRTAWQLSYPMLSVVKVPTLLFTAAGLGWLSTWTAIVLSQLLCIAIMIVLGARVGWVISKDLWHPILGATGAGALGVALAAMNHAIH